MMNNPLVQPSCQYCHAEVDPDQLPGAACPHCGQPWTQPPNHAETRPSTFAAASEDDLVDNLRAAFGFDQDTPESAIRSPLIAEQRPSNETTPSLPAGSRLGDFEILEELGRGGMGVVYRARQVSLGRLVALKVLPGYARHGAAAIQRFRAEAQAAARLHHTNVVGVYAQGEVAGQFYYAMELVEGAPLSAIIQSRPQLLSSTAARDSSFNDWLNETRTSEIASRVATRTSFDTKLEHIRDVEPTTPSTQTADAAASRAAWTLADYRHVARLLAEVADALAFAHDSGVIHRDIKPHNLLLGSNNSLHVTDFGLARLTDEPHLTVSGEVMGTPAYLSPEQIDGHLDQIDHRTDIYSLGVTLYEVLSGEKPFDSEQRAALLHQITHAEPPSPRRFNPRIPRDLETICLRAIEKDPHRRHPSAALLAEDLHRFADGRPILSRRVTSLEKAAKWVRRHKAVSSAIAAGVAALCLAAGWLATTTAQRTAAARELVALAYNELAYHNYGNTDTERARLTEAAALGLDDDELHLPRALAAMGATEFTTAETLLREHIAIHGDTKRALYLLAWAHWESHDRKASVHTRNAAEALGDPSDADTWFFRALALQYDRPDDAVAAYRQAIRRQAATGAFYPQAVLHLARARNQQLYSNRTLDSFDEARSSFRQLVDNGYYGARPYYYLSIANRLAAEIYRGSTATREDLVQRHYDAALHWAREGQRLYPNHDQPFTAEAAYHESIGELPAARTARTDAIKRADIRLHRWENYHYRWRLNFWLGDFKAALADLAECAAMAAKEDADNLFFYTSVYPAWVHAANGDRDTALALAHRLADDPNAALETNTALRTIWAASLLRTLGTPDEADQLLARRKGTFDFQARLDPPQTEAWLRLLYDHCQTGDRLDELEALAESVNTPWRLSGEAWFHTAALHLARGDRDAAVAALTRSRRSYDGETRYSYHARVLEYLMTNDSSAPTWFPLSWKPAQYGPATGVANSSPPVPHGEEGV
jgi:serine/threonine protein kinase